MPQNHELLMQAADLLEKTAAHIEETEGAAYRIVAQHQQAAAQKIASQLSSMVGAPVAPQTVTKMAGMGTDVVDILNKLAGDNSGAVESMGGPAMSEKTASSNVGEEDRRFLAWLGAE